MRKVLRAPSLGLTLPELLVVLAVSAVLIVIGMPSFAGMLRDHRLTVFTNELHAAILLARSEAIRRGHRITLCPSEDGLQCSAGTTWDVGWIMFSDINRNGVRDLQESLISVRSARFPGLVVRGNATLGQYVSYLPNGISSTNNGALQMGAIRICNGVRERALIMNAAGRIRVERSDSCS